MEVHPQSRTASSQCDASSAVMAAAVRGSRISLRSPTLASSSSPLSGESLQEESNITPPRTICSCHSLVSATPRLIAQTSAVFLALGLSGCRSTEDKQNGSPTSPEHDTGDLLGDSGNRVDTAIPDLLPPTEATAEAPFGQRVVLRWTDPNTASDGLVVAVACARLDADPDGFCTLAELSAGTTEYVDHTAHPGLLLEYRLTAVRGEEQETTAVEVETPPVIALPILPVPQGAWRLGGVLPTPTAVRISTTGEDVDAGLLLDAEQPASLPSQLAAAGLEVSFDDTASTPAANELHIRLAISDDPAEPAPVDGLLTFQEMGDEGFVLRMVEEGSGTVLAVGANTPAGLYRGGMAATRWLLNDDGASPRVDLEAAIVLDYPDHPVRGVYDGQVGLDEWGDASVLSPTGTSFLDSLSQAGANHLFLTDFAYYPYDRIPWRPWEDMGERIQRIQEAAADRFIEVVVEVGKTSPSPSQLPQGFPYIDGLGIFEEPFELVDQSDGSVRFEALHSAPELIPDSTMSSPDRWSLPTSSGCDGWTYDPAVGHDSPGSFRLDADGDGDCAQLQVVLDPDDFQDGRYWMSARVRSDIDSAHLGPYTGSTGQVTLVLRYTDGTSLALPERSITIRPDISTVDPHQSNKDGSDWHVVYTTFQLDTHDKEIDETYIYIRSLSGTGTFWMDELSLTRIDGSLRNIVGGVAPPIVTDSTGNTVYAEGVDYEVCQRGIDGGHTREVCTGDADDGQYTTVFWANSPGGTLEWGLESRYSSELEPFVFRWIDSDSRPPDDRVLLTYDVNLAYPTQHGATGGDHQSQRYNLCAFEEIFEALDWSDAHQRVLGSGSGELGAQSVRIDLSEFRGVNRSHACLETVETTDGLLRQPTRSNAARFADTANHLIEAVYSEQPAAVPYFWDDMLNPMYNGGHVAYQQTYGGPAGATACALGPEYLPSLCSDVTDVEPLDPSAVMIHWSYVDRGIRSTAATAAFYDRTDRSWLVGTGGIDQVTHDWAAIARASPTVLGVSAFEFKEHDIPHSLRTFWNHDSKLAFLVDFESEASSHVQIDAPELALVSGSAEEAADGSCGVNTSLNSSNWTGNSEGGLCVDPADALHATTAPVETQEERDHRAGLFLAAADDVAPRFRFTWQLSDGSEVEGDWLDTTEVETQAQGFRRYETAAESAPSPVDTVGVVVELTLPAGVDAIDNLMLWTSTPPCFDECEGD